MCVFSVATTTIAGCDDDDDDGYDGQDALSRYNMHPTHMRGRECLFVFFFCVVAMENKCDASRLHHQLIILCGHRAIQSAVINV